MVSPRRQATVERACLERIAGARPRERNVLAVTYGRPADAFVEAWHRHVGVRPRNLGVVDVGGGTRSVGAAPASSVRPRDRNVVTSVADPGDLPAVMEAIDLFLDEWGPEGESVVHLDSATKLLYRVGTPMLIGFLDELGDRLRARGSVGYLRLEEDGHDARTLAMLGPTFDSVLELSVDREGWSWTERARASDGLAGADSDVDGLPPDSAFDILQSRQRRLVLHAIRASDGPMRVSELAERIAALERDSKGETEAERLRRIHAGLRHVHFPALEQNDIVTVDSRDDTIELEDAARRVEPFLSLTAGEDLDE